MIKRKKSMLFQITLLVLDLVLINLGYLLAFLIKFGWNIPAINFAAYLSTWPWLTLAALSLFYFYGLYGSYRWRWAEVFASLICVLFFQALAAMALSFLFRGFSFPRSVLLTAPFMQLALLALWRRVAWLLEKGMQETRKVIVVGQPLEAVVLAEKLESATGGSIKVAGFVVDASSDRGVQELERLEREELPGNPLCGILGRWPVLGDMTNFCDCLDDVRPDQVFACSTLSQEDKAGVVYACVSRDRKVSLVPDLYEIMLAQARLEQVDDVPVFTVGCLAIPEEAQFIKRATDILLSLAALAVAAPLYLLAAFAIKLDSPGPVLYRQKRLTLQGKPFYLYKFRTMVVNAEQETGPVLASENDPRVTRVGRFLRAARIDEIPQLLNVLKGDMSIVGPRPERPFFVNELIKEKPEYIYRMNVKSGITGLAQIAGRYSTSPENKLKYDLLYTKSYSPAKDLAILLQTVKVILMKDRAS
ncbi:sugar transferase [Pelotomaculum propionicicum]|uniref:UDP-N-acetylgalactosamine-undecaprenyl-phosphate N-acetylgalactosaminephosphotransferase n=1 Tax=Pelotomaculum propionicicum TaxID=258475 RepID=A0A4Y7RN59_9FIRM|nr:sugar transferase [Pelotomaculum propionicicum]TEB09727.1 UDP-N-acetylgalactosamine-undecaprenyl-phosphate N-acetylgalactosaminephosphotransferase [Pelotomaculum propionicicum]